MFTCSVHVLALRLPCWYISSYTVVTPNTLNPSSFPDIVHITLIEVNLMAYFLRFPTLVQFSSLENILDSVLRMTHLWFGITFLMRSALQTHLPLSGQSWSHTSLEKHTHPKFPISFLLSPRCWPLQCLWFLNIEQCFCVMRLRVCLLTEIKRYKSAIRIRITHTICFQINALEWCIFNGGAMVQWHWLIMTYFTTNILFASMYNCGKT